MTKNGLVSVPQYACMQNVLLFIFNNNNNNVLDHTSVSNAIAGLLSKKMDNELFTIAGCRQVGSSQNVLSRFSLANLPQIRC